ncbi:MAG: GDSL family lipase, partial [Lachnospiraceae bacterium]
MNTYIPGVEREICILGRTADRQKRALFWTGSGIEFAVNGSELYIDFTTDYDIYEQWVRIEVDGFS